MNTLQKVVCKLFGIKTEIKYIEKTVYVEKPKYIHVLPKDSICLQGIHELDGKMGVDA